MADSANGFNNGTNVLLFAKLGTPAVWKTLACLKTNSWDGTTDQIDYTTKCSGLDKESAPGDRSSSFKADGNAIDDSGDVSKASFLVLSGLWNEGTTFPMKMVNVEDPLDIIRGSVYITSLGKGAGRNEAVGFSASFQVTGPTSFVPEVA